MHTLKYIKSLDGLRAIAVLLVIIHHWLPPNNPLNLLPNGMIGVTIFFVLSGFLISQILFQYKSKVESNEISMKKAIYIFYIRRSLRIFPIYYLYIFFFYFYGYKVINENFIYFLTYTSNILFFLKDVNSTVDHLWTLAVEEQYYFIWPFIVLLIPVRYLKPTVIYFILIGIISQYVLNLYFERGGILTFTAFDSFGLGALLAYYNFYFKEKLVNFNRFLLAIYALIFTMILINLFTELYLPISWRFVVSLIATSLIMYLNKSSESRSFFSLKKILENNALVAIGTISYGIYLYHTMVPGLMDNFYEYIDGSNLIFKNFYLKFTLNFIVVLVISKISWEIIERPINSLKNRFQLS
jgi:peptidoglycan/LPS O-acetylase OafA/YrhL